ncbi:MAG: ABC transporter ATP-binding protein [Phycisphaerales bacterium]
MSTAVVIREIVKSFGAGAPAVAGVSLRIEPGELFFLLGPSGCGKTTLLRMIAGFTEPTSGRIEFETPGGKRDVTHLPPNKRNTGMVFQSYALWPHMTIAANVAFGLEVRKIGREETQRRVREALALVQMETFADRKPNQLSGGQQQRVALARALVVRPDVLLLDEPLSNLDAKLRVELRGEIRRICKQSGITTVYVTHDQKEALSMADRVAIMSAGSVAQIGSPAELYRRPGTRFVAEFLGETNFLDVARAEAEPGPGDGRIVRTSAGMLRSTSAAREADAREGLVASIRPEALRVLDEREAAGATGNLLRGRLVESTYLGELAQLVVELRGDAGGGSGGGGGGSGAVRVKVAVLNPQASAANGSAAWAGEPGTDLVLSIEPADVVLMPATRTQRTT